MIAFLSAAEINSGVMGRGCFLVLTGKSSLARSAQTTAVPDLFAPTLAGSPRAVIGQALSTRQCGRDFGADRIDQSGFTDLHTEISDEPLTSMVPYYAKIYL